MHVLIIDTTTKVICLGLYSKGSYVGSHTYSNNHAAVILKELDQLLKSKGIGLRSIEYIAMGIGPGSFSGLKISSAIVQSIMVARDIPVITFSSMLAMALTHKANTLESEPINVITYANINNFYVGQYRQEVSWEKLLPQVEAAQHISLNTWGDERVKQLYPQCKLLYKPLALDSLIPYIESHITEGKFATVLRNTYYL